MPELEELDDVNQASKDLRKQFREERQEMGLAEIQVYLDLCKKKYTLTKKGQGTIKNIENYIKKRTKVKEDSGD